jgi:transposase
VELLRQELVALRALVAEQVAEISRLKQLVTEQAAEIARLRGVSGSGKTPQNSSLPPASVVPPNRPPNPAGKQRGPRKGHRGISRKRCQPDRVIELRPERCRRCGADLSHAAAHVRGRSQQVELPPLAPVVVEVVRYRCTCPTCGTKTTAAAPVGWDCRQRFGPRLQTILAYLHHHQHIAYARLRHLLRDLFGLSMSEGAIAASLARTAKGMAPSYAAIRETVRGSPVVGSDETRARVAGESWWDWVVHSPTAVYHWVAKSRAAKELAQFFGASVPEVQLCDLYPAQRCSPAEKKAVCQAHQLRDLRYAAEQGDTHYAPKMARLIRLAIHLWNRREALSERLYRHQGERIKRLAHQLAWGPRVQHWAGQAQQERYRRLEQSWWVFLERDDVEPTNNASERALRPAVIHRKVNGSFRSEWGAEGYVRFLSIAQTAQRQGQPIFPTLLAILAPHPVPIPE